MKIYDFTQAPNPRRVRVFLAEKGLTVPFEQINIGTADNRKPEFLKINPMGTLPVLELDDGTRIAESVAICRYFEETKPEPPLMGVDAKDKAVVEMWNRRMELNLFGPVARTFQNTSDFFKGRFKQFPEYGAAQHETANLQLQWLDQQIGSKPFIAGDRFTIADITAEVAVDFGAFADIKPDPALKNLARWHQAVSSRPSAKA